MDKTHFFCADCENRLAWRYLAKIGRLEIIPCKCKSRPSTGVVEFPRRKGKHVGGWTIDSEYLAKIVAVMDDKDWMDVPPLEAIEDVLLAVEKVANKEG